MSPAPSDHVRLQKFLSDAGVASRRYAEEMILAGRVLVNDEVVQELPVFVDPGRDRIIVDGTPVRAARPEYFLVHKPKGVVCTDRDPAGRRRAVDLLPDLPVRLFLVGRLDAESTGLLLMTNDGELAQRLTHPRYGVPKTYHVEVRGRVPSDLAARMKAGVYLAEGKAQASDVRVVHTSQQRSVMTITLREGRNRQVRRMLARLGFPVKKLKRIEIGTLSLKGLPVGASRRLTPRELTALRRDLQQADADAATPPRRRRKTPTGMPRKRPRSTRKEDAPRRQESTTAAKTNRPTRRKTSPRDPDKPPRRRIIT